MADTLEIFGVEYPNATGIKATDDNGVVQKFIRPQGSTTITTNGTHDVTSYASAVVNVSGGGAPTLQSKTKSYTPSETAQSETITADSGYDGLSSVEVSVGAISSSYVGSGITRRSSSDLTASGATVTVPAGYYESQESKAVASGSTGSPTWSNVITDTSISFVGSYENFSAGYISSISDVTRMLSLQEETVTPSTSAITVTPSTANSFLNKVTVEAMPSGTAGTPTATKGSVDDGYGITVTPSVTNTTGYITGGTKTGTGVRVTAREIVSGESITADDSGEWDVANYETLTIPDGTAGTPSATKGTVSNHTVSVTPSVTNSAGWINGGTKTGSAVTVSASELVSGTLSVTSNGTTDCTTYASVNVAIPIVTYYTGTSTPASSLGQNGDIYLKAVN